VVARPPQLLGEGGERDRRRVFVNPASKLLNAPMSVRHDACESGI
jgi:hypothetical protein